MTTPRPARGRAAARGPRGGRALDGDIAVSDVVGTILLVAIAVVLATTFTFFLLTQAGPTAGPRVNLEAYVLPNFPTRVVIEHQGGEVIPIDELSVLLTVGATDTAVNVGERLRAGDAAWAVVGANGQAKTATGLFAPSDRVFYNASSVRGAAVTVFLEHFGSEKLLLGSVLQETDATAPTIRDARTTGTRTVDVNFTEPLLEISLADFTFPVGTTASSVELVGNNSRAVFEVSSISTSATPLVSAAPTPSGTKDLAGNLLGNSSATAVDGIPPGITVAPSAGVPGVATATITWTTDESSDSRVEFGPTILYGRNESSASLVTSHSVALANLTSGTLYRYRTLSADANGNTNISVSSVFITKSGEGSIGSGSNGTSVVLNLNYPSTEQKSEDTVIGLNILNPTTTAYQIDSAQFSVAPALGSTFFNSVLSTGAGSDAEWSCTWTGAGSNEIRCDPSGTFTLPAVGMKQLVVQFKTASTTSTDSTILTAQVNITSPDVLRPSVTNNVRHIDAANHMTIVALSGSGGSERAGFNITGGSPVDFYFKWRLENGAFDFLTRFSIPPGWRNVSVPDQTAVDSASVSVRQPTEGAIGYVAVIQAAATREIFIRATPPAGSDLAAIDVDMTDFEGRFYSLMRFGVKLN